MSNDTNASTPAALGSTSTAAMLITTLAPNGTNSTASILPGNIHTEDLDKIFGDPVFVHAFFLVAGLGIILSSEKFPKLLAALSALLTAVYIAVLTADALEAAHDPEDGELDVTRTRWLALAAGAGAFVLVTVVIVAAADLALGLLVMSMTVLLGVSAAKVVGQEPGALLLKLGSSEAASAGVAIGALVILAIGVYFAKKMRKALLRVLGAVIGSLLLVLGGSFFASSPKERNSHAFVDDLLSMLPAIASGECKLDKKTKEVSGDCDCGEHCLAEIVAWFATTCLVYAAGWYWRNRIKSKSSARRRLSDQEDTPLARTVGKADPII